MYILNQNGRVLLKGDQIVNFELLFRNDVHLWVIEAYTAQDRFYLGEFTNRSQAVEVLDELAMALTGTNCRKLVIPANRKKEELL